MKILFVILDTLRRDYLQPYGGGPHGFHVYTPAIQRLAQRSVTFDNHWVGSLPCMPARREFMTGRHNFLERGWGPLEPFDDVLPEQLRRRERRKVFSHLITDHYHYFYLGGEGHNSSFSTWQFERGQENDFWISRVDLPALPDAMGRLATAPQHALNRFAQQEEADFSGPRCVQHCVRWLEENRSSDDWFLQLELFDPHEPFYTVPKYLEMYGDTWSGPIYDWPDYGVCKDDPAAIAHIRRAYAALLTMTDHWLGRLWDALDRLDLWKDTMVVLTTDHGTMLAEHDYWMKNQMPVFNEIARIPLIVHLPGDQRSGARVAALTQTTDVMPTFLDYFDAPMPPHLHGRSLRPAIEANEAVHEAIIYGYFGMAVNATDGHHTYFRNPASLDTFAYAYTSMPTQFHGFMPRDQLAAAEMGRFLSHTYNIPLYRVPQTGRLPHRPEGYTDMEGNYRAHHALYDLATDPGQERPIEDAVLEGRFVEIMRQALTRVGAPAEQHERLGIAHP